MGCYAKFLVLYLFVQAMIDAKVEAEDETKKLNAETCGKKYKKCCDNPYTAHAEMGSKCVALHKDKLPPPGEQDSSPKAAKFITCLFECIYKQKKYIGKGDSINMKMVKADGKKTFKGRPKEQDYHNKMYEHCSEIGKNFYNVIKSSPSANVFFKDACSPYFFIVYLCTADYHRKNVCPYFRWEGDRETNDVAQCANDQRTCYEIDGIKM